MPDGEHSASLADDPLLLVLLLAAGSLAIALTSCLWHHFYSAHLAIWHVAPTRPLPLSTHPQSLSTPVLEEKDRKSTRSKDRRRRGKDPLRDLFKGGKKSKALLKAIKAADNHLSPSSADMLPRSSVPGNDSDSSTSRSPSPDPLGHSLDLDRLTPPPGPESDDGSSAKDTTPNADTSSVSAVPSSSDLSDHSLPDVCSPVDDMRPSSPGSLTAVGTQVDINSASTVTAHATKAAPSFPPAPTPQPRDLQTASTSGSCVQLVRARTRIRASKIDSNVKSSSTADSVASSSRPIAPCPRLSISASTHSTDAAGPSTPTIARLSTSPPRSLSPPDFDGRESHTQPTDQGVPAAQAQLASMRDALEAARRREDQLRIEAERANKERDELCWRWNEDADAWRRREAELQAHIHHLVQQLQAYAAVASFQAQQQQISSLPSSGFSSPTSPHAHPSPRLQRHAPFPLPPPVRAQDSASPSAHVQALLASTPMLVSHPPGFAAPVPTSGGAYPGAGFGMSPLLWSGMGLCTPSQTPDPSSRGRRRQRCAENARSTSDESSPGDWDGSEDEDACEAEAEDIFRNNALADAILKRPESIRDLSASASARKRSGVGQGKPLGMAILKDPALERLETPPPAAAQ